MHNRRLRKIIAVIVCLVIIRGLIYGLIIPFNQSPDEKHYFMLIKAKHLQLNHASKEDAQRVAAQIELTGYYLLYPDAGPQKRSLQDFAERELPRPPSSFQIYYLLTGWLLKILSLENIRNEIYAMRGLSILCGILVVLFAFLATWELFPENTFMLVGVPAFITFIPQFSAMNGVVNNDKLAEVFLAVLFWSMVRIFKYGIHVIDLGGCVLMMVLAILTKRTALFTVPFFLMLLFVYYWKHSLGIWMHVALFCMFFGIGAAGYYLFPVTKAVEDFLREYIVWTSVPSAIHFLLRGSYSIALLKYYVKFFIVLYWSFWGMFGYMSIHLHHFWYMLAASVQVLSISGLVKFVLRKKMKKNRVEPWMIKVLYLFVASIVLVVGMMFFRSIVLRASNPMLAQGRRLFPVILPIGILTVFGLERLFPSKYHRLVGTIGIIGLLILDVVCLSNYILLNFHARSLF